MQEYWGYTSFRPLQEEIIDSVISGKDTVALLPTSGGKSICFQVPAMAMEGICIVVSPLVALMADQVSNLKQRGIKAMQLSGGMASQDLQTQLDNARYGNYKFLYLSPERLQQEVVQSTLKQLSVNLIAVDEAHCISQWGNDFRPAYKNVVSLREMHPLVPVIALTATATNEVLDDTIKELQLEIPAVFKASFTRANIRYGVLKEEDKLYRLQQLLQSNSGKAIVYVRSRKTSIETSQQLNSLGIPSTFYHGGIAPEDKEKRMQLWQSGVAPTMVATNAFGMGIDQPDVRLVVHIQLPDSLEAYFQEAGRAGRDGTLSKAVIIWSDYDKTLVQSQFVASYPTTKEVKHIYKKLNSYFQMPYGEGAFTAHPFNFTEFCKTYNLNVLLAYNALQVLDRLGVLQLSKTFGRKSVVQFTATSAVVLAYFKNNMQASVVGKTILRMYGGIFEIPTNINLQLISSKSGQAISTVISVLQQMEHNDLLSLKLNTTDAVLTFNVPREDDKTINPLSTDISRQKEKKARQVAAVIQYIENDTRCRSVQLVSYFGEVDVANCGICSVCVTKERGVAVSDVRTISENILTLLEAGPKSSRELSEKSIFAENDVIRSLRLLLDANKVTVDPRNRYHIK